MNSKLIKVLIIIWIPFNLSAQGSDTTYAERLGFPKNARVLILHVDDAGMSLASNEGAECAELRALNARAELLNPANPSFLFIGS